MTNPFNVEKTIQKYQQLAKDAQTLGDPVLLENYLQHADHFSRRLQELNQPNVGKTLSGSELWTGLRVREGTQLAKTI